MFEYFKVSISLNNHKKNKAIFYCGLFFFFFFTIIEREKKVHETNFKGGKIDDETVYENNF